MRSRALLLVGLLGAALAAAPTARAGPHMEVGLQDDAVFVGQSYYGRALGLERARALHVTWIRANIDWANVLPARQAKARRKPAHPHYDFSAYDGLVDDAARAGIHVELTLAGPSPAWAAGNHKRGPYAPRLAAWRRFVALAARHFKGRVPRYTIWNEPNYVGWLQPFRKAPVLYRGIYRAAWNVLHRVDPRAQVLIGETSPYHIRRKAWAPLSFLRRMFCLDARYRHERGCRVRLLADGYAQHPYNYENPPTYRYPGRDNVTIGTLYRLTRALDRLRRAHALGTRSGRRMPVYLTEFGYFTFGYRRQPEPRRARYEREAFSVAARNPRVRQMLQYQLVEPPAGWPWGFWKTYLIHSSGRPSPTYRSLLSWAGTAAAGRRIAIPAGPLALPRAR